MFYLHSFLILVQAGLWRIGGAGKQEIKFAAAWYRDVLIPVLNFLYYWITGNFIVGFLTGAATLSIRMGYGAYDPEHDDKPSWLGKITKDREGWKIRMIYAAITSFSIGLIPTLYHVFFFYNIIVPECFWKFLIYIIINVLVDGFLTAGPFKGNVWVVEPVTGASRALVLLLCN